jgi:hypothetical protein
MGNKSTYFLTRCECGLNDDVIRTIIYYGTFLPDENDEMLAS